LKKAKDLHNSMADEFHSHFMLLIERNRDSLRKLVLVAHWNESPFICDDISMDVIASCKTLEHLELDTANITFNKIVTLYQSNPRLNFVNLSGSRGVRFTHSVSTNELKWIHSAICFPIVRSDMNMFFNEHCRGIERFTFGSFSPSLNIKVFQLIAINSIDTLWKVCLWDQCRHDTHKLIEWCPNVTDLELKTTSTDESFSMSNYSEENKPTMVELCKQPTNIRRLAVHGCFFNGPELQMFVDKNLQLEELAIYKDIWTTEKRTKIALSRLMNHISKQNKAQGRTRLKLSNLE